MSKLKILGLVALAVMLLLTTRAHSDQIVTETEEQITPAPKVLTPKEKISREFADATIMVHIAQAESTMCTNNDNPTSSASGCFQILRKTWSDYKCEGNFDTDSLDVDKNIACARKLYNKSGTSPWNESKHVWGKYLK